LPSGSGRVPLDLRHLLETPVARLRPPLASQPELLGRFDALVERVATRFEGLRSRLWDWGFCHGDLHAGNALVDGERLALFDFDCCGPGWRLYDLATYRWAARLRRVDAQAWSPFIEAYLAMRPKAADSIEHVPLFIVLRQIWLQGYYASNAPEGGVSYQSDGYFEGLVSFLEKLESESLS
jgi:Ser/Thr protein kinase RdoA (MazF antagonist)